MATNQNQPPDFDDEAGVVDYLSDDTLDPAERQRRLTEVEQNERSRPGGSRQKVTEAIDRARAR